MSMEYSRKVSMVDGPNSVGAAGSADSRVMDFGSVFLVSPSKAEGDDAAPVPSASGQPAGINVAELVLGRGFGTAIRHRDFEERSNYYDALLAAESRAINGKKGIHSARDPPAMHITDLTMVRIGIFKCVAWVWGFFLLAELICNYKFLRPQQRKREISCHFCNALEGSMLLLNMFSAVTVLNYSYQKRHVVLRSHFLVLGALVEMSLFQMKQLL